MSVTRSERPGGRRRARPTKSAAAVRLGGGATLPLDPPDLGYMVALAALISIGMVMVYSTTAMDGAVGALQRMGIWLAIGAPLMVIAARMPISFWRRITPIALILSYLLLISLEIPGNPLAVHVKGATRWLRLVGQIQIQPSEVAKLAFVLFAAGFLERRGERMTGNHWIAFLGVLGTLCAIIYKEPDLGTALVLAGTAFCMLISAGAKWRTLASMALVGVVLVGTMAWSTPHQRERLQSYWNPFADQYVQDKGYQVVQSWMAMARGGLWGVGLGQSQQKNGRLPESDTDFIFAIVAEELGLVRAVCVLGVFGLLTWRGYEVAARAPDRYSSLVASGVTAWIGVQACLNVAVVTGSVPNTGVPLPFISSGGSSLLMLMTASGIVVGISRRRRIPKNVA